MPDREAIKNSVESRRQKDHDHLQPDQPLPTTSEPSVSVDSDYACKWLPGSTNYLFDFSNWNTWIETITQTDVSNRSPGHDIHGVGEIPEFDPVHTPHANSNCPLASSSHLNR